MNEIFNTKIYSRAFVETLQRQEEPIGVAAGTLALFIVAVILVLCVGALI